MKSLQKPALIIMVAVFGGLIYQYFESLSISTRVTKNTDKIEIQGGQIETLQVRVDQNESSIEIQGKEISVNRETISEQSTTIEELQKRIAALSLQLTGLEKTGTAQRQDLDKIRSELRLIQADFDRRLEQSERRMDQLLERDDEREARLKSIEKSLGVEKPQP